MVYMLKIYVCYISVRMDIVQYPKGYNFILDIQVEISINNFLKYMLLVLIIKFLTFLNF